MPPERKPLVEKTGLKIPEEDVMNLMVFGSDEMAKGGWRTWERILIEL